MKDALRCQSGGLPGAWNGGLKDETKRSAISFFILWALFLVLCTVLPELRSSLAERMLSTLDSLNATDSTGRISALSLFSHNVESCAFIMIYGLIPFVHLPALAIGVNAMLLGVMAAWYLAEGISPMVYLAALLPHAVFELPALFLAFGMGLYACGQLTRRCRGEADALTLWSCLVLMSRVLLLALIPLLAAAALIEAYITPLAAALFF